MNSEEEQAPAAVLTLNPRLTTSQDSHVYLLPPPDGTTELVLKIV
jgi:hypothetical protein